MSQGTCISCYALSPLSGLDPIWLQLSLYFRFNRKFGIILPVHSIAIKFCRLHDILTVVPCAKLCNDRCITIWMRANRIQLIVEKSLMKWVQVSLKYLYCNNDLTWAGRSRLMRAAWVASYVKSWSSINNKDGWFWRSERYIPVCTFETMSI